MSFPSANFKIKIVLPILFRQGALMVFTGRWRRRFLVFFPFFPCQSHVTFMKKNHRAKNPRPKIYLFYISVFSFSHISHRVVLFTNLSVG